MPTTLIKRRKRIKTLRKAKAYLRLRRRRPKNDLKMFKAYLRLRRRRPKNDLKMFFVYLFASIVWIIIGLYAWKIWSPHVLSLPSIDGLPGFEQAHDIGQRYRCICQHACFVTENIRAICPNDKDKDKEEEENNPRLYVLLTSPVSQALANDLMARVADGGALLADVRIFRRLFVDPSGESGRFGAFAVELDGPHEDNLGTGKFRLKTEFETASIKTIQLSKEERFMNLQGHDSFYVASADCGMADPSQGESGEQLTEDNEDWNLPEPDVTDSKDIWAFEQSSMEETNLDERLGLPIKMLDIRYRRCVPEFGCPQTRDDLNDLADAITVTKNGVEYGVGLRFNYGKGQVLLTSLEIEKWPDQGEWEEDMDALNGFVRLVTSLFPDEATKRYAKEKKCECEMPFLLRSGREISDLLLSP
uniref:Uncharacterized protein n=1 Tax=Candidatus Kentrum sp. MB TaxID=2138164 RepID=A0A451B7A1_9GAMM|nr:MAG: hypothetical protein BECKMB1821H_GA0114242_100192 [Candidatus Kentron sp. MB]